MGVRAFLWLMAFGAIMAAAVFYSVPADAEPGPQLTSAEVLFADHGGAVGVCEIFDQYGLTAQTAVRAIRAVASVGGFPLIDSAQIINYSVYVYCPRHWPALVAIGNAARAAGTPQTGGSLV